MFGGDELKKQKEIDAAKKASRKKEKDAKKAKRAQGTTSTGGEAEKGSVEAVEKDGAQSNATAGTAVEEVTEGVRQAALQTS